MKSALSGAILGQYEALGKCGLFQIVFSYTSDANYSCQTSYRSKYSSWCILDSYETDFAKIGLSKISNMYNSYNTQAPPARCIFLLIRRAKLEDFLKITKVYDLLN